MSYLSSIYRLCRIDCRALRNRSSWVNHLTFHKQNLVGWLVALCLTTLSDSISDYIRPSPKEREKEKRNDRREKKCPNNPHPHLLQAQYALALLLIQISRTPRTGSFPSPISPPDHPHAEFSFLKCAAIDSTIRTIFFIHSHLRHGKNMSRNTNFLLDQGICISAKQ